jgi:hypothetical protein
MYPATTNQYPVFTAANTNVATITLYKDAGVAPLAPTAGTIPVWDTPSTFSFTVTAGGNSIVTGYTNIPVSWLQGAKNVKATITVATNTANNGGYLLLNSLGISGVAP